MRFASPLFFALTLAIVPLSTLLHGSQALAAPGHTEAQDFSESPYTEYGEFNEEEEEAEDTRFFQSGRFFGIGLGVGYEGVAGNRAVLWQGGFPSADITVIYWFDFNTALDLNIAFWRHYYEVLATEDRVDIGMTRFGASLRYYFGTKDLSAAIAFANPYVVGGFAAYTRTDTNLTDQVSETPETVGAPNVGAGLEFAIKHRKSYLQVEGRAHLVNFKDTYSTSFLQTVGLADLTGVFYSTTVTLLLTW